MKTFRFLLIGLGVLLIFMSLGIVISRWNTDGKSAFCETAARSVKKLEDAVGDYETAKASRKPSYELAEYLKKVESAKQAAENSTALCAGDESAKRYWQTRKILLGVLGIVMLGIGFVIGRKRKT